MGSVQRLATVVIVGLVALSTILFLYLGDEDSRITAKEEQHQEASISRAIDNYVALCLQCHGPAGEGLTEPGAAGTGRIGAPLGGVNTSLNQEGINAAGTPWPGGVENRADIIRERITEGLQLADGTYRMPAFGGESGSLTDEQIEELVVMIQHVDWNEVYNESVEASGGYPTPPPAAATEEPENGGEDGDGGDGGAAVFEIVSNELFFEPAEFEITADTDVTISLPNEGAAPHNFAIDELDISIDLAPGETKEVVINAPPGEYEFYCNVPGHKEGGMFGTLTVTEGAPMPVGGENGSADDEQAAPDELENGGAAEGASEDSVEIVSIDIAFQPSEIEIPANTDVTFALPNEGAAPHNFSIDELDISIDLAAGETKDVVINAPPGEYEFYCNVPGHREAGMVGTLTVTDG